MLSASRRMVATRSTVGKAEKSSGFWIHSATIRISTESAIEKRQAEIDHECRDRQEEDGQDEDDADGEADVLAAAAGGSGGVGWVGGHKRTCGHPRCAPAVGRKGSLCGEACARVGGRSGPVVKTENICHENNSQELVSCGRPVIFIHNGAPAGAGWLLSSPPAAGGRPAMHENGGFLGSPRPRRLQFSLWFATGRAPPTCRG